MRELQKEYLTPFEVEAVFGLSRAMLAKARTQGNGPPFYKANRQVRYRREDVEAWLGAPVQDTQGKDHGGST